MERVYALDIECCEIKLLSFKSKCQLTVHPCDPPFQAVSLFSVRCHLPLTQSSVTTDWRMMPFHCYPGLEILSLSRVPTVRMVPLVVMK